MNAKELVAIFGTCTTYGKALIDAIVETEPIGDWIGGQTRVLDLGNDPNAPEIVMNVRSLHDGKEIGVFDWEDVSLVTSINITTVKNLLKY